MRVIEYVVVKYSRNYLVRKFVIYPLPHQLPFMKKVSVQGKQDCDVLSPVVAQMFWVTPAKMHSDSSLEFTIARLTSMHLL